MTIRARYDRFVKLCIIVVRRAHMLYYIDLGGSGTIRIMSIYVVCDIFYETRMKTRNCHYQLLT